jgi:hypothetical protein
MPILILLRQYGLREYAITLGVAALAGLGIAVLINSAAGGGAGPPALLKTKQELADASSRVLTTRVFKPVSETRSAPKPVVRHRQRQHRHARSAPTPSPSPAPRLVAVRAPAPTPQPQQVSRPAPAPVVHRPAPVYHRPAPAPKPASKPSGGGSTQFDDSG